MKTVLKAQMGQNINLTPQLLQSIRLLQLDGMQLELEIASMLERNPLLEREPEDEDGSGEEAVADIAAVEAAAWDELPEAAAWTASPAAASYGGDEDPILRLPDGGSSDLRLRVLEQLSLELDADDMQIAAFILDYTDDNGYLEHNLPQLAQAAAKSLGCQPERFEEIRQRLLHGEPAGYAASTLGECLLAQLAALPAPAPGRWLAECIVREHLELLATHDYAELARRLQVGVEHIQTSLALILSLQPRPGQDPRLPPGTHVVPDVLIWRAGGEWRVALNAASTPRLRIDPVCERMLAQCSDGDDTRRMRELLQEARWMTHGLSMRNDTLLRTAMAIVERQRAFLDHGDEAMAPLTLKEIAETIGMHESTISRITSGKFIQTPRGTFEFKRFFAVRLEGASVSGAAVRAMVKRLIAGESQNAPLADDTIARLLARNGIHIARRTVAKYREQLNIAPARQRRQTTSPALACAG